MKVKIKKIHPDAVIPRYAKTGDAGLDLVATSKMFDQDGNVVYGTGLCFEIPEGYVGLLLPRSSNSKTSLLLTNHCGVLDSGYRGEVLFKFRSYNHYHPLWDKLDGDIVIYKPGDRIGQLIILPYPSIEFEEVQELSETERGEGSYGSTGR